MDEVFDSEILIRKKLEQMEEIVQKKSDTFCDFPFGVQNHRDEKMLGLFIRGVTRQRIKESLQNLFRNTKTDYEIKEIVEDVFDYVLQWQVSQLEKIIVFCNINNYHYTVLEKGKLRKREIYVIFGITLNGERKILDILEKENDSLEYWMNVLYSLKKRGVEKIMFFYSGRISAINEAISRVYKSNI